MTESTMTDNEIERLARDYRSYRNGLGHLFLLGLVQFVCLLGVVTNTQLIPHSQVPVANLYPIGFAGLDFVLCYVFIHDVDSGKSALASILIFFFALLSPMIVGVGWMLPCALLAQVAATTVIGLAFRDVYRHAMSIYFSLPADVQAALDKEEEEELQDEFEEDEFVEEELDD